MTDQDKELRRLAEAATPGPWKIAPAGTKAYEREDPYPFDMIQVAPARFVRTEGRSENEANSNAAFIAAANPATILSLLDRLEAAETAFTQSDKTCRDLTEKVIPNLRRELEAAERTIALLRNERARRTRVMTALTIRLKEAEKAVVFEFNGDHVPSFRQGEGAPAHELESVVTAERCAWLVAQLEPGRRDAVVNGGEA